MTLHLYRRAIAGAIARGLSLHKRSRLHFVRGSRGEAARVAEEAKNHFETGRCFDSDGFSARHSSREYGYYEQFRGSRSGPERHYEYLFAVGPADSTFFTSRCLTMSIL